MIKMGVLEDELMEIGDGIPVRKRKVLVGEDPFAHGKRIKFESFPSAASKLAVSAVTTSIPDEENDEECKFRSFSSNFMGFLW